MKVDREMSVECQKLIKLNKNWILTIENQNIYALKTKFAYLRISKK